MFKNDARVYKKQARRTIAIYLSILGALAAAALKEKFYVLGGWDGSKQLDEIVTIDPESGYSSIIGYLPSPREYVTAASLSDKI